MDTTKVIKTFIHKLRERPHVVEFAKGCAERAQAHADDAANVDAADDDSAHWINAAAYAAEAVNAYATVAAERDLQITHLRELHAREEK